MTNYQTISLAEARREYLATTTTAMPIGGLISWGALAAIAWWLGPAMPPWMVFTAAASPVLIALLIDKLRGKLAIWNEGKDNPVSQLFMRFITVVALLTPLVIFSAIEAGQLALLVLGMAILAGMVWVPHGWGADDPAGFRHFVMRAILCYAAYYFAPEPHKNAAIAAAAALTYVYAIWAMKKPEDAR